MSRHGISRREFLRRGTAFAGAAGLASLAAACGDRGAADESGEEPLAPPFPGTLRVLGLALDVNDLIERAAEGDLGFRVRFEATSAPALVERSISRPGSFDVLSAYADQIELVWPAGNLVGLDRTRIERWHAVTDLYKLGKVAVGSPACTVGEGDAPFRVLYATAVHSPGELVRWGRDDGSGSQDGRPEPAAVAGAPSTFALDSFAYRDDVILLDPEEMSWGELLNRRWQGRVGLPADPVAGLQAAALAARALGLISLPDVGALTSAEIDGLARLLLDLKARGQFRAFWSTPDEAVDLLASGEAVVEPVEWPGVALLQSSGYPVRYAAPPEGYLGWAGMLCVSKAALESPSRLQACYDYVNWWHSGVPGAILMRYGSYNAVPGATRGFVSPDEWDYWIEGKPAASDLDTPFAQRAIKQGQVRDGGSLRERACRIGAWRSHLEEPEHAATRWSEVAVA